MYNSLRVIYDRVSFYEHQKWDHRFNVGRFPLCSFFALIALFITLDMCMCVVCVLGGMINWKWCNQVICYTLKNAGPGCILPFGQTFCN